MRPEKNAMGNLFGREDAIEANRCLNCSTQYTQHQINMWPDATQLEYCRCGLCRQCQAVVFQEDLTQCTCDSPCCEAYVLDGYPPMTCGSQHCPIHGETA